jgi:hypothetical protein
MNNELTGRAMPALKMLSNQVDELCKRKMLPFQFRAGQYSEMLYDASMRAPWALFGPGQVFRNTEGEFASR